MLETTALPFVWHRHQQEFTNSEYTATSETVHGLLRLDAASLYIQWRITREVRRYGVETNTDRQQHTVREVEIPLIKLSDARVKRIWYRLPPREALVLTASDLQTFEVVTAEDQIPGLALNHPAELVLEVRRRDRKLLHNFVSALRVSISERVLASLGKELEAHKGSDQKSVPELGSGKNYGRDTGDSVNEKGHT